MAGYSAAFLKDIEKRIDNGSLKVAGGTIKPGEISPERAAKKPNKAIENLQALGRMNPGRMNKTEAAYAQYLEALKSCGEILWYEFECIKLRLADSSYYTVDFFVMRSNGELEAHEVKGGHAFEDSIVKLKGANEKFPWPFYLIRKAKGGGWSVKKIGNKS